MAALAFKAISYGAEQIPDKVFEKIPGGFFTPAEKKKIDKDRKDRKDRKDTQHKDRYRSEERPSKRSSRRERSPVTDQSDYSAYDDTDYERERERRKRERRRAKSAGRTSSRSLSRGRRNRHSSALYGQHSDPRDMALPGQGQPYFPPPPTSEYRPYNPQEYAPSPGPDHRPSATPAYEYGYSPQVNRLSSFRRATLATMPEHPTPVNSCPPMLRSRTTSNASSPFSFQPRFLDTLSRGSPVSAAFAPSYEPPLAAMLHRPLTNTPKPAAAQPYPATPSYGQREPHTSSAARYTPGPGYSPSPVVVSQTPIPPPVGSNSPLNPYHHNDYPASNAGYQPSPPPFTRQRSNSQPTFAPPPSAVYPTYIPPSASQQQMAPYNEPPSRRDSAKPRREHRHRARSVDSQSHHSRSSKDHRRRDDSRMAKARDRFDEMDPREKGLASALGGALAGGFAGRSLGKSRLTTLAGAAAGALGARQIATRSRYVAPILLTRFHV
jgi:hypothetical protein